MARVNPVSQAPAGWSVRITYWFTRRAITALTGWRTEAMIEPVQVYARIPALLRGYAKLEQATAGLTALPDRVKALAELRAATLTTCEYCIDLGSQVARRWGLTDAQLLALVVELLDDADVEERDLRRHGLVRLGEPRRVARPDVLRARDGG